MRYNDSCHKRGNCRSKFERIWWCFSPIEICFSTYHRKTEKLNISLGLLWAASHNSPADIRRVPSSPRHKRSHTESQSKFQALRNHLPISAYYFQVCKVPLYAYSYLFSRNRPYLLKPIYHYKICLRWDQKYSSQPACKEITPFVCHLTVQEALSLVLAFWDKVWPAGWHRRTREKESKLILALACWSYSNKSLQSTKPQFTKPLNGEKWYLSYCSYKAVEIKISIQRRMSSDFIGWKMLIYKLHQPWAVRTSGGFSSGHGKLQV